MELLERQLLDLRSMAVGLWLVEEHFLDSAWSWRLVFFLWCWWWPETEGFLHWPGVQVVSLCLMQAEQFLL